MRCGRVRLTLFFPLHNSNFLYQIENVVCYPFRTANLVDNGTKEGQIGEGCKEVAAKSNLLSSSRAGLLCALQQHLDVLKLSRTGAGVLKALHKAL